MAAAGFISEDECRCPICFDIFEDPVMMPCGHSFCDKCIKECWRQTSQQACPVCRTVCPVAQPPRNLALRNLSESLRKTKCQDDCAEMCTVHSEKLKLFCEDDQQLICVICRDSKSHKTHNCVPVNEAAETQRAQLKVQLMSLRSELGIFQHEKTKLDGMANHIKVQTVKTEKTIKGEFHKLYRFLRAEETNRIDALRKEKAEKSRLLKENIAKLVPVISALTQKISNVEKELRAKDVPFMKTVKDTLKLSQCELTEPKTPKDALIDEAKHVSNLLYTVWKKMENVLITYVPVTMDPNTASKRMIISNMMTSSATTPVDEPLPDNPERTSAVLGYQGFKSGQHFWDVKMVLNWALGVVEESSKCSYGDIAWGIHIFCCDKVMRQITPGFGRSDKIISKGPYPQTVRVLLDCDQGTLTFIDLDKMTTIHTIKRTFRGKLFPYFEGIAEILPAKLP